MAESVQLYLIRHGIAEERGSDWPDDTKRPLTRKGMLRLRRQTAGMAALGVAVDLVLTSPLVRTHQTARILARGLPGRPRVVTVDALAPGATPARVLTALRTAGAARIACVGHEPDIGRVAAALVGAAHPLEFKKGAVCRIDLDALPPSGPGRLRWYATPRMLRLAART